MVTHRHLWALYLMASSSPSAGSGGARRPPPWRPPRRGQHFIAGGRGPDANRGLCEAGCAKAPAAELPSAREDAPACPGLVPGLNAASRPRRRGLRGPSRPGRTGCPAGGTQKSFRTCFRCTENSFYVSPLEAHSGLVFCDKTRSQELRSLRPHGACRQGSNQSETRQSDSRRDTQRNRRRTKVATSSTCPGAMPDCDLGCPGRVVWSAGWCPRTGSALCRWV